MKKTKFQIKLSRCLLVLVIAFLLPYGVSAQFPTVEPETISNILRYAIGAWVLTVGGGFLVCIELYSFFKMQFAGYDRAINYMLLIPGVLMCATGIGIFIYMA